MAWFMRCDRKERKKGGRLPLSPMILVRLNSIHRKEGEIFLLMRLCERAYHAPSQSFSSTVRLEKGTTKLTNSGNALQIDCTCELSSL